MEVDIEKEILKQSYLLDLRGSSLKSLKFNRNKIDVSFVIEECLVQFTIILSPAILNSHEFKMNKPHKCKIGYIMYKGVKVKDSTVLNSYEQWVKHVFNELIPVIEDELSKAAEREYAINMNEYDENHSRFIYTIEHMEAALKRGERRGIQQERIASLKKIQKIKRKYRLFILFLLILVLIMSL